MRVRLPILALLPLILGCTTSVVSSSEMHASVEQEVRGVFDGLVEAASAGDSKGYFAFFDQERFSALRANGSTTISFTEFREVVGPQIEAVERYESIVFEPLHISVLDAQNAIVLNEYLARVVLKSGDVVTASGAGAQIWSKQTGTWKLVHISDAAKR